MTLDTIFDLASLTKVVATTTARDAAGRGGTLRLTDPVAPSSPASSATARTRITIRHLLTHTSGLRPDLELERAVRRAPTRRFGARSRKCRRRRPASASSTATSTSSCSATSSSASAARRSIAYAARTIFEPLGMRDTMFLPPASLRPRIAPTERCEPLAWPCGDLGRAVPARRRPRSDGAAHGRRRRPCRPVQHGRRPVASSAGCCSAGGTLDGVRMLSPPTVAHDDRAGDAAGDARRARARLGHRLARTRRIAASCFRSARSATRDSPARRCGSIRRRRSYVVFLSNRVHPDGKGDVDAAARARRDGRGGGAADGRRRSPRGRAR